MGDRVQDKQEFRRYAGMLAIASGLFILFMSLVFLVFSGNRTRLNCQMNPDQNVDCRLENTWFSLFTISEQVVLGVRQADIGEHCDEEGDCTYRLELVSGESNRTPLTPFYSAGRAEKQAAQGQINTYLQPPARGELGIVISGSSGQVASVLLSILAGLGGGGLTAFGIRLRRR